MTKPKAAQIIQLDALKQNLHRIISNIMSTMETPLDIAQGPIELDRDSILDRMRVELMSDRYLVISKNEAKAQAQLDHANAVAHAEFLKGCGNLVTFPTEIRRQF